MQMHLGTQLWIAIHTATGHWERICMRQEGRERESALSRSLVITNAIQRMLLLQTYISEPVRAPKKKNNHLFTLCHLVRGKKERQSGH